MALRPAEILLRHQRLDDRARSLAAEVERIERDLSSNPEAERLAVELAERRAQHQSLQLRLRDVEREVEGHRTRMKAREKELMSGRIRNPSELIQMSEEVGHMKARLGEEEEQELLVMEEVESRQESIRQLEAELEKVQAASEAAAPELTRTLERDRAELALAEAERDRLWEELPAAYRSAVTRIRVRPAAAEVVEGKCSACRVQVTSSGMQQLRRGEDVVGCDNCGRVLVLA